MIKFYFDIIIHNKKFQSKEEALSIFIGKREPTLISIETYYFDRNNKNQNPNCKLSKTNPSKLALQLKSMTKFAIAGSACANATDKILPAHPEGRVLQATE